MGSLNGCKKVVVVGDSGCGKSALAVRLTENVFLESYQPTDFEGFRTEILTSKGKHQLSLLDTSGSHAMAFSKVRSLAYRDCDAVVICFDLTEQSTLTSVEEFWIPEALQHCPSVPLFLVGCKKDATCSTDACSCSQNCCMQRSEKEVLEFLTRTGVAAYAECSSAVDVFCGVEQLIRAVVETSLLKKKVCNKKTIAKIKKQSKDLKDRFSILGR